jgi:glycine cleavage system H lipoate-binding protein
VPGGVYVAPEHTWVSVEMTGEGRIGLDEFFHKTVGAVDDVELPTKGAQVSRGEALFRVRHGDRDIAFPSPLTGRVSQVNHELTYDLELFRQRPYEAGWICCIDPSELTPNLRRLRIGADAVGWYQEEVENYRRTLSELVERRSAAEPGEESPDEEETPEEVWQAFATSCMTGQRERAEAPS